MAPVYKHNFFIISIFLTVYIVSFYYVLYYIRCWKINVLIDID